MSTIVFEKEYVGFVDDSFVVNKNYSLPHFEVRGNGKFSGNLSVNVTGYRWDLSSGRYTYECHSYPCEWDLDDSKLDGRGLWVITENNGTTLYEIESDFGLLFVILY